MSLRFQGLYTNSVLNATVEVVQVVNYKKNMFLISGKKILKILFQIQV